MDCKKVKPVILKEINPEYSLEDWCWSWNSNALATWWEEPTHWKRPWCWERLKAGEEGDNRGWWLDGMNMRLSKFWELVMVSNHLIFLHLPLLWPSVFPSIRVFSRESALCIRWSKYQSFSFSISLPMNIQGWFPLEWLAWPSCSPWDSQESSPAPQFKSTNSSALDLYGPTLISVCGYWKLFILVKIRQ